MYILIYIYTFIYMHIYIYTYREHCVDTSLLHIYTIFSWYTPVGLFWTNRNTATHKCQNSETQTQKPI